VKLPGKLPEGLPGELPGGLPGGLPGARSNNHARNSFCPPCAPRTLAMDHLALFAPGHSPRFRPRSRQGRPNRRRSATAGNLEASPPPTDPRARSPAANLQARLPPQRRPRPRAAPAQPPPQPTLAIAGNTGSSINSHRRHGKTHFVPYILTQTPFAAQETVRAPPRAVARHSASHSA
jgi:hypothetical protein